MLNINGYQAIIAFDSEIDMYRGEFIGLNGGADFYASSVDQLKKEGAESLRIFLDECKNDGIDPAINQCDVLSACIPQSTPHL